MSRQWFRMYAEAVDDEKLRLLAFEDRWHFVAILCCKGLGTIDSQAPHLERRLALKLGLQLPQLDELKRRLLEVRLIDENWQPIKWDSRQYESDSKSESRKSGYVYFIGGKSGDVKIGYSKNPWARVTDIRSESGRKNIEVLATVRTSSRSEVAVHDLLAAFRKEYEWFERVGVIEAAIHACVSNKLNTEEELLAFISSNYVATTNRAEQSRAETEQSRAEVPAIAGLDVDAWTAWTVYRKQIGKPVKPASIPAAQRKLAAHGTSQAAVVEQSIANGWQGLFELKTNGAHRGESPQTKHERMQEQLRNA